MKKVIQLAVIVILTVLLTAGTASAITIGFDPVSQEAEVGSPVEVALFISGLGDEATPSLSTFDLDISFDPAILAFNAARFGDPFLGDQLDIWGVGLNLMDASVSSLGVLNIWEVSLDSAGDLLNHQEPSFTLARLTFNTLAVGFSSLDITVNKLGDEGLPPQPLIASVDRGTVNVVPEPGTFLLVASGLAGFRSLRRKFPMRP